MNNNRLKSSVPVILVLVFAVFTTAIMSDASKPSLEPTSGYSEMAEAVEKGSVAKATLYEDRLMHAELNEGGVIIARLPAEHQELIEAIRAKKIPIRVEDMPVSAVSTLLSLVLPLLLIGVPLLILLQVMKMSNPAGLLGSGSGKKKAEQINVTFADVAGVDSAKQELREVVEFLKDPARFRQLGSKVPKGVLLVGPPGTVKTLLAKAVAGEAGVSFLFASGSEFVEMFVGVGARRVRQLFADAKAAGRCIIFIDEIDAIGGKRGESNSHSEREQTLNQLLVELDGMAGREGILIIAATNRVDALDQALIRPGRFDRRVHVDLPDLAGRQAILKVHTTGMPLAGDVSLDEVARGTPGFSGADLANLVNEASLFAGRRKAAEITSPDFEDARDRILMGAERPTLTMTEHDRNLTAYHEAGHALVTLASPASDPIHKATILPRGGALGMVMRLPEGDRVSLSRAKLKADMAVAMGGRVAEEMIFGPDAVTTGASADLRMATSIARRMVTEWGMSDAVGPVSYATGAGSLAFSAPGSSGTSEATAQVIDAETRKLVDEAMTQARRILTEQRDALDAIAQALIARETLTGQDLRDLYAGVRRQDTESGGDNPT